MKHLPISPTSPAGTDRSNQPRTGRTPSSTLRSAFSGTHIAPLVAAALAFSINASRAQHTFGPTSGNEGWNIPANWTPASVPNAPDAEAIFLSPAAGSTATVSLGNETFTVGSLKFDLTNGSWNVASGGFFHLARTASDPLVRPSISTTGTRTLNLRSGLTGTQGVELIGSGQISLLGNNNGLSGGIHLKGPLVVITTGMPSAESTLHLHKGELRLGSSENTEYKGNIVLETTETTNHAWIRSNSSGAYQTKLSGIISGNRSIRFQNYQSGGFELTGTNTYTGDTEIAGSLLMTFHSVENFGTGDTLRFINTTANGPRLIYAEGNTDDLTRKGDGTERIVDLYNVAVTMVIPEAHLVTFENEIRGSLGGSGLIKDGEGTLRLASANTYQTSTIVQGGSLLVNNTAGSGTGTSAVSVKADALLGGTGILKPIGMQRGITLESAAIVAPGDAEIDNGIGTLTFDLTAASSGLLQFEDGSRLLLDLATGLTSDRLIVHAPDPETIIFAGTTFLDLNDTTVGLLDSGEYIILSADHAAAFSGLTLDEESRITGGLMIGGGLSGYHSTLHLNDGNVILSLQAIPEPSSVALLLIAAVATLAFRRSRPSSDAKAL